MVREDVASERAVGNPGNVREETNDGAGLRFPPISKGWVVHRIFYRLCEIVVEHDCLRGRDALSKGSELEKRGSLLSEQNRRAWMLLQMPHVGT